MKELKRFSVKNVSDRLSDNRMKRVLGGAAYYAWCYVYIYGHYNPFTQYECTNGGDCETECQQWCFYGELNCYCSDCRDYNK